MNRGLMMRKKINKYNLLNAFMANPKYKMDIFNKLRSSKFG